MAIRRIIDLPVLSAGANWDQFLSSMLEISYPEVDSDGRLNGLYTSKSVRFDDFADQILADVKLRPTHFKGKKYFEDGIEVSCGMQLSGDLLVNADDQSYHNYTADLKFGDVKILASSSLGLSSFGDIELKSGAGQLTVKNSGGVGSVQMHTTATVDTTVSADGKAVVNMEQLLAQLAAWKAAILAEIGKPSPEVKQTLPVPVGTVISWTGDGSNIPDGYLLCDGREVAKDTYSSLYSVIGDRFGTASSGKFKLPQLTDSRYLQGSTSAGTQKAEELPAHTHTYDNWFLAYGYSGDPVCDHASSTTGMLNRAASTTWNTSSASSSTYKAGGNVVPKSTTVLYLICYKLTGQGGGSSASSGMPLLSFVYLDHEIEDASWKKAGSIVDLTQYSQLYSYVLANKGKMRFRNSGNALDTWYYSMSDEKLTLPKTEWFIQGGSSVAFRQAGLPDHTHTATVGRSASNSHGSIGNNMLHGGDSACSRADVQVNNVNSGVYGKSDTVQPNATKMFIYFYVGPKD